MTDTPTAQRWVAAPDSARQAAGAFLHLTLRSRRSWLSFATIELLFAILISSMFDDRFGPLSRVVWGCVYALVPTTGMIGLSLWIGYLINRRRFRQRLGEGVVLESVIGEDQVVLRGPVSASTLSLAGIASLRSSGDWVFLQQVGSPLQSAWPTQLFPAEELDRLKRSIATRQP